MDRGFHNRPSKRDTIYNLTDLNETPFIVLSYPNETPFIVLNVHYSFVIVSVQYSMVQSSVNHLNETPFIV